MAANEKDIKEFEVMFDLSSDKDDSNEQAEEYGHSTGSSEPFEELAAEVFDKIEDKGNSIVKEDPHDIIRDVCSAPVEEVVDEEPIRDGLFVGDNFFNDSPVVKEEKPSDDELREVAPQEKVNITHETESLNKNMFIDDCSDEIGPRPGDCPPTYGEVSHGDDKIEWMLTSPAPMYSSFYAKKRDLLFKYMVGGQIEYTRWTNELVEAEVIIRGEIFDHQSIISQMEAVQQHRERVKAIHVRVNNQYYTFKRFVEMMRGFLARIEYLKPVTRQEGLIMEHMRDLELYYARLEALHDSATKTEKTLEKAFDTLSRKCTICMELRPPERVDKKVSSTYVPSENPNEIILSVREYSKEFDEFDDLPMNAQAAPKDHKVGAIGWSDV